MRYLRLATEERQALLARLETMPDYIEATFAALSREQTVEPGPGGAFSPVEQGVGAIALCDVPAMMDEHDTAHRTEIEGWRRTRRC